MEVSYDYYRVFYYVAKYRNITQAANVLMNNQPNITRAIKNLEAAFGCPLFLRSNRGVTLTPEGEKLYAHVAVAFQHLEDAELELTLDRSMQKGMVSIGATEVALHTLLLPVLKEFRKRYPGVRVRVSNHSTPQAVSALRNGLVDFAVVTTPMELPQGMEKISLKTIREAAVCGAAFSQLAGRMLSLPELAAYPLICLGSQTQTYALYANWFSQNGLVLKADIEAATADQILPMVRHDLGIGFVPEEFLAGESEAAGVIRLKLAQDVPERSVCLIRRGGYHLSIAAKELEKMLLEQSGAFGN